MEERNSMNEIVKLMHQIGRAMEMSRDKQANINKINDNLMEETRPMMVEKMKEEVKLSEQDKTEYDDMTKNSLVNAKKDILKLKEGTEKEYQEKLIETATKHRELEAKLKRIEDKLASERAKGLSDDKMQEVERAAQKAIDETNNEMNNINNEMKDFQNKHFTKRSKLVEFENSLQGYAMELGFESELANVKLEEAKPEEVKPEEVKPEGVKPEGAKPVKATKMQMDNRDTVTLNLDEVKKVSDENNKYDHKKVLSIEVKDNKYYVTYENKKSGVYNKEMTEVKKLGLFKNLSEKIKLISNRNEYGIDLKTALRADSNILSILNDKSLKRDYKEMYIKALDGGNPLPFEIKYDKNNRYAKALQEGQKKLELKAGITKTHPNKEMEEYHEEKQVKYDLLFGEGFDQHDNPPTVDQETERTVQDTVSEILSENNETKSNTSDEERD